MAGLHSGLRDIFHFHKMSLSEGRAEYHERPTAGNPRHMVMLIKAQYHLGAESLERLFEAFDPALTEDETLSGTEYIKTRFFNLLASNGLAECAAQLSLSSLRKYISCFLPPPIRCCILI